jgi:D-beta-D-heptose 7-phosphate kinase/D-beta-D-heptose 1-phosphate adenosyltransferase
MTEFKDTRQQRKFKILLIGDSCIDEYYYGTCDRLNPEAPVPVLKITRIETMPGMAANVQANLESFGCDVDFMTGGIKSVKQRYIDDRSKQHIIRVDDDKMSTPFNPHLSSLQFSQYDAIVISDYNKGFITYDNIEIIRNIYSGPIFVDTKKQDIARFDGCFVKINEQEYNQRFSICSKMIVTLGSKGAMYKTHVEEEIFPVPDTQVVDVCGAGDTFLAALAYEYLNSLNIRQAIKFANICSAITVRHRGVYSLTTDDIHGIINNT